MAAYEKEQERLHKLMLVCLSEDEFQEKDVVDYDTDEDELHDNVEERELSTDTEQEVSDSEEYEEHFSRGPIFVGKDKVSKWSKHAPPATKTRAENIITHLPGPKIAVRNLKTVNEIWQQFFDLDMLRIIVESTNKHIQRSKENYSRERNVKETDIAEVHGLISLLYLAGVLKAGRLNVSELWRNDGTGVEQFRLTMSKFRFQFLLQHLRFDDMDTRTERRNVDRLAPIRDMFNLFVEKCQSAYTPFQNVTIDEKLEAFRGRCGFRVYIPRKPNKYGLKVFALVDSKTFYTSNLEVYVGA